VHDPQPAQPNVTQLLAEWREGRQDALEHLTPIVFKEMHALAARYMSRERRGHTLQPTALVNEAFLRLAGDRNVDWQGRSHFIALAANHMRRILVDHARHRGAQKRGGAAEPVTLEDFHGVTGEKFADVLILNDLLERLAKVDERKVRAVEMRFFGGLEMQEIADVLGIHSKTVQSDLRMATAWLRARLACPESPTP